ncbi:MAG: biotin/lipoyl-binding protein, partial [Curvibacter sp.]
MASKILYPVIAVVGIAAASGAAWWFQHKGSAAPAATKSAASAGGGANGAGPARPVTVEAVPVRVTKLSDDAQSVGSLRSRQSVMLRPEVSGRVVQLNFKDGERVRKGQLLVQFDDQLQQAQIKQS